MSIRFAIASAAEDLAPWQLRCLEQLLAVPEAKAVLHVQLARPSQSLHPPQSLQHTHQVRPSPLAGLPVVMLEPAEAVKPGSDARPADLAIIRGYELDFILSFPDAAGAGSESHMHPQGLRECARFGLWRYQFGDWMRFRGGPAGYWEVYEAEPVSAALLVRETSEPDAVIVLREGFLRTALLSPARNCEQLLHGMTYWPAQLCIDLRNGLTQRLTAPPLVGTAHPRRAPNRLQRLLCSLRILGRMGREAYGALFRHTQWNVGLIEQPIAAFLSPGPRGRARWLPPPPRAQFRADPFGLLHEGRLTILYELFDYVSNRGTIAAVQPSITNAESNQPRPRARWLEAGESVPVQIGPEPAVHLSYPYLFEVAGRLLCLPEAHESGALPLYELSRFPDRWQHRVTIPIDRVVVDATPFVHAGRWWIAGSEPGTKGASSELYLWFAPAIEGPWQPHAGNPVKVDIRSVRPAGTPFVHEGALYRPAQDCSRSYGGRVLINRVDTLSPTEFEEVVVAAVDPDPTDSYGSGIHTLSQVGGLTLIDGKRTVFVPEEFLRHARHFLQKLSGRSRTAS